LRLKQKTLFHLKVLKNVKNVLFKNVTNQMIVFSAFIQSGYRATAITLAHNWFPFQCSKINKYKDHFSQCSLCHIINLLLTKLVWSGWLGIGLVPFLCFVCVCVLFFYKNAKGELGQYPAILISRLVNNIIIVFEMYKSEV